MGALVMNHMCITFGCFPAEDSKWSWRRPTWPPFVLESVAGLLPPGHESVTASSSSSLCLFCPLAHSARQHRGLVHLTCAKTSFLLWSRITAEETPFHGSTKALPTTPYWLLWRAVFNAFPAWLELPCSLTLKHTCNTHGPERTDVPAVTWNAGKKEH